MATDPGPQDRRRIDAIDLARGVALVAMAIYHFAWDLEFFGYAAPGMTAVGGWKLFARSIASSFLFLAGVSLVLGHGDGIRWPGFLRRLAMVAGAALLITAATYIAVPGGFIFFGILHEIAVASVLGLIFLRVPWPATALAAGLVIAAPAFLRSAAFDSPALWWLGLSDVRIRSNDYVPVFPWFGAVLLGMAATQLAGRLGLLAWMSRLAPGRWSRPLLFAGRHSLAVYLIHQPVLLAMLWLASQLVPPQPLSAEARFMPACRNACTETRDSRFCSLYCGCMLETLQSEGVLDQLFDGSGGADAGSRIEDMAATCTARTDAELLREGTGQ